MEGRERAEGQHGLQSHRPGSASRASDLPSLRLGFFTIKAAKSFNLKELL